MPSHTPGWKWVSALAVMATGLGIAIPLGRYAEQDDAPGGVVIAVLVFVIAAVAAMWIVNPRPVNAHGGTE